MEEIFKIRELTLESNDKIKFIVFIDVINETIIIRGYYKLYIGGTSNFKLLDERNCKLENVKKGEFQEIINIMYETILERVKFAELMQDFFKDVDHVEIGEDVSNDSDIYSN